VTTLDKLVLALAPGFAAGFAVQRLLEIVDAVLAFVFAAAWANRPNLKTFVLMILSIVAGFALAIGTGVRVLQPLGATGVDAWDVVVTALVVSAGTEGANSILKYLGYKKDEQKKETAKLG
jgi:carbon starvation protein CstA